MQSTTVHKKKKKELRLYMLSLSFIIVYKNSTYNLLVYVVNIYLNSKYIIAYMCDRIIFESYKLLQIVVGL
jgi:hypothetical protein